MNKIFFFLAAFTVAFSVSAQGPVRRLNTIAELQAIDPAAVGVGATLSYEVAGYTLSNIWENPRIARWDPTSALAQDGISVFTNAGSGRFIFDDAKLGTVNVRWANARGDGVSIDSVAFQTALNYVKTLEGTLIVPAGRFVLTNSLDGTTAATGFTIQGAGKELTEIIGNDPGYPLLDFTGANGVTLRDFTVWGNAPGTNVSLCGILWGRPLSNASSGEHIMERLKVWGNFQKWGVIANSAELCVYRNCEFYTGYNLAPPDNAMTAFCLSGGSGTRGLTSRYNAPGDGSGGNSSQSFYDCKFFNYTPVAVTGYYTTYNLELDGVMTCTMVNPYYYSRYNGTQVKLNNLSTSAFDTLDIIGARHEYLTPLSGGTEPASYSAAAAEKFKSIRIQGGTLTYLYGEGGSWITGLKINDVMWKTIASVPVVDVWILIDSDLYANKGGDGSFAQTQTPTYSIRGWSHNVNIDYLKSQNYGMHSVPDLGFGRRGLLWDAATTNSAVLHSIPTNRIGTNDFTIYLRVRLPASMPGNHAGIATLTANPAGLAQASAWTARLKTDGRIETFLFDASGSQYSSKYVPSDFWTQNKGEICDLAFVRTTNDCKVYINGWYDKGDESQDTGSPPGWGAHINASVFALGLSGAASQYWRSEMYRAALFDRALTDTEILALTHSTKDLDTDALIPDLTQGFGTRIADLGSGGYVGALVGGVSHLLKHSGISLSRTPDWVNVVDYGADDDPGTDDTLAMQAAAAALLPGQTLYAPPGLVFRTTNTVQIDDSRSRVDFSGSTIKSYDPLRHAVLRVGPREIVVTNMDFTLDPATNLVVGVPSATFSAGDMVMLYNDVQSPANYNPGQFAFIESASGTEIVLDRFPDSALQVTNAYHFVAPPESVEIRNVVIDLSGAADGTGISVIGRGHLVENCRVIGTGTTNDPNYIGIELRGQSITARKNFVQGILDAGNAVDRSGYGIFATGDNIVVEDNELLDCKHCVSTSERKAVSHEIKVTNNRIRQRDDWAGLTDVNGAYLFTAALDVHANVRHIEFRGNDVKIGGRYALSLRNDNFDVLFNRIEVTAQTLPFAQHTIGLAEEMVERGLFHGNQFITADGATLLYFAQADSGVSGTHSNLSFVANSFKNCILSLDDYDSGMAVTNGFANTVISGNTFNRLGGTTLLFSGPSSNAIVTGNAFTHGGSGVSVAVPGDDTTNPAREIYIAGNTFSRTGGTAGDVRFLSGPTNIVELGNNRFSDVPTQGFDGQIAVSRTPPSSYRYQLITADDDELWFNSTTGTTAGRLRWGGAGAVMGYETEFFSYRLAATDRAFSSGLPGHSQRDFVIKADGLQSWSDGTNAASIVLGPRRIEDLTNGVLRLSGAFGLTEHAEPITPSSTTATIWLEEADTAKSIKVKWPDGSNTSLSSSYSTGLTNNAGTVYGNYWPGANIEAITNGTQITFNALVNTNYLTNSWQIAIDSTIVLTPNLVDSTEINPAASGTNLSFSLYNNSIATNKIDTTFYNWVLSQSGSSVYVDGTGVTNIKTSADITFTTGSSEATPALTATAVTPGTYTNATITVDSKGRLTAASVTAQPQRTELSVDGSYKSIANLADSAMIAVTAAGTNVSMTIPDGVITTNKVDSTFYAQLSPFLGKATWTANPNSLTEVADLSVKGIISDVLFSTYAAGGCGGGVAYDEYEIIFSSSITAGSYGVIITFEGSTGGITPTGGIRETGIGTTPYTSTGFKIWRQYGNAAPCLSDGYRITVLVVNY